MRLVPLFVAVLMVTTTILRAEEPAAVSDEDLQYYESKVRPLLVERCYECHSSDADIVQGGLLLDTPKGLMTGGDTGPAIVARQPDESRLLVAVRYEDVDLQMPPDGQLPPEEIAILQEWIERGAPTPPDDRPEGTAGHSGVDIEEGKQFWSFRPLQPVEIPTVGRREWIVRPIDAFVLARVEAEGLSPSQEADRATLIRRVSFDLIGLPPTPEEIAHFVADPLPDAYERLVERLLASPHYGERWGRHWLDLVRYCDVPESWAVEEGAQAWLYRDWVIEALNHDLPYNLFVQMQLAADQQSNATPRDLAALGFLGLSPSYWKELKLAPDVIKNIVAEEWEERINTFSGTVLGLTVACARCHDHKFDPVTQDDYYALAGVFASIRQVARPLLPADRAREVMSLRAEVKKIEEQIKQLRDMAAKDDERSESLGREIDELEEKAATLRQTEDFSAPTAYAVEDASLLVTNDGPHRTKLEYTVAAGQDVALQIRGNAAKPSHVVPRRYLSVLSPNQPPRFEMGSGRKELADAVFRDSSPLVARVMVNRVWRHHFGRGFVETTSNFGTQGDRPTHPQLLEYLSREFIRSNWSLKWLHREIVLSATYRQSSHASREAQQDDPENRWLSHMNRRRLEVEAWRDAMLSATGSLDTRMGGAAELLEPRKNVRRTVYGEVKRRELPDILRLYDFPDGTAHSPKRLETTTPLQQLFVLNSDFLRWQADELLARLARECDDDQRARIDRAFWLLYGRSASENEMRILRESLEFANSGPAPEEVWREVAEVLLASNELMYVE